MVLFQSPTRDSGRSSGDDEMSGNLIEARFQSPTRDSGRSSLRLHLQADDVPHHVSIPHSGFWPFKLGLLPPIRSCLQGFNPPLGILAVQAGPARRRAMTSRGFNPPLGILAVQAVRCPAHHAKRCRVSIPHSGFWPFKPTRGIVCQGVAIRFQSPTRDSGRSSPGSPWCSSVSCRMFQSPTRDSGRSSFWRHRALRLWPHHVSIPHSGFWPFKHDAPGQVLQLWRVSIPHSGFWPFKRGQQSGQQIARPVSIPHSGFWPFKLGGPRGGRRGGAELWFQSPTRDSGRSS